MRYFPRLRKFKKTNKEFAHKVAKWQVNQKKLQLINVSERSGEGYSGRKADDQLEHSKHYLGKVLNQKSQLRQ